jgi:hypothetical protein
VIKLSLRFAKSVFTAATPVSHLAQILLKPLSGAELWSMVLFCPFHMNVWVEETVGVLVDSSSIPARGSNIFLLIFGEYQLESHIIYLTTLWAG